MTDIFWPTNSSAYSEEYKTTIDEQTRQKTRGIHLQIAEIVRAWTQFESRDKIARYCEKRREIKTLQINYNREHCFPVSVKTFIMAVIQIENLDY